MASYLSSWSRLPYPLWGRPLLGKGRDNMFLFATLADATQYLNFQDLMGDHSEIAFSVFGLPIRRSEEHTSELQSLMRISYAVSCLNRKKPESPQQPRPAQNETYINTPAQR